MTYDAVPLAPGRLLLAAPALTDPNFARSVVYLLDHDHHGSMGVIINRPTPVDVAEVLPGWQSCVSGPPVIFQGGPVALDSALGLVRTGVGAPTARRLRVVSGEVSLLDLDSDPAGLKGQPLRIFVGHSGWAAGQLGDELADGAWIVLDGLPEDPFADDPGDLWRSVLRRQPGSLSWLASFPDDPSLN